MGPEYCRPEMPLPNHYIGQATTLTQGEASLSRARAQTDSAHAVVAAFIKAAIVFKRAKI